MTIRRREAKDLEQHEMDTLADDLRRGMLLDMDDPGNWQIVRDWLRKRYSQGTPFSLVGLINKHGKQAVLIGKDVIAAVDGVREVIQKMVEDLETELQNQENYRWN